MTNIIYSFFSKFNQTISDGVKDIQNSSPEIQIAAIATVATAAVLATGIYFYKKLTEKSPFSPIERVEAIATFARPPTTELDSSSNHPLSVEALFHAKKLIVRALDDEEIFADLPFTQQFKLGSFKHEMNYLEDDGLKQASGTLILPEKPITLYRPLGFLFNGNTSILTHIYGIDSNSSTTDSGDLQAGSNADLIFSSLHDLSQAIEQGDLLSRSRMNEVKGHYWIKDLMGLVVRTASSLQADAILNLKIRCAQKEIQKKFNHDLPIYKYDEDRGTLQDLSSDAQMIRNEILNSRLNQAHKKLLEKHLLSESRAQ